MRPRSVEECSTSVPSRRPPRSCATPIPTLPRSSSGTAFRPSGNGQPGFPDPRASDPRAAGLARLGEGGLRSAAARLGEVTPAGVLASTDEELRADGFSRQKARYVRALSTALGDGSLDLDEVASLEDEAARTPLVALPGIGAWTAECYLLSALRRPDVWPVGDIALQEGARRARRLEMRPTALELESDRRGVATAPRHGRAAPLAPVPQRARALGSDAARRDATRAR